MFRLLSGMYNEMSKLDQRKVLLIGPESSGKTVSKIEEKLTFSLIFFDLFRLF